MIPPSLRVLLVEDNPGDADLLREALEEARSGVSEVVQVGRLADGQAALKDRPRFDVVLLDLSLPDATGLEAVRRLHAEAPEMPLVVVTGQSDEEMGPRAVAEGAQDYLLKGQIEGPLLVRAVRYAVGRHRFARALAEERIARAGAEAMQTALRQADQRKDEFLALLSHELRNPLAPILNAVELLRHADGNPERGVRAANIIEKNVRHMVRLIDDLLDVSRITRGKITLKREVLDLASVIGSAVELAEPLVEAAGHELLQSLPDAPVLVEGDRTRVAQILANLLNNAAKFTLQRGTIRLGLRVADGQAVVSVSDNGIGIDPQVLPRIFDLFVQGDASHERSRAGLGLGLALAKSLVEMHGGSIEGQSDGPGKGSTFVVRLPLVSVEPALTQPQHDPLESAGPARLRVLVVDDNGDAVQTMTDLLTVMGHEVRAAPDGVTALRLAEEFRPQAVLLDICMPEINGYEVARRLRQAPATRAALLIAVTGLGHDDDRRKALEAGFDHYLTKPADPRTLRALLAQPCFS